MVDENVMKPENVKKNYSHDLPEYKISDIKAVFDLFKVRSEVNNIEYITPAGLHKVMNSLGFNPTEEEIEKLFKKIDLSESGTIEFEEFVQIFYEKIQEADLEDDLIDSFKNFEAGEKGLISESEFIRIMTSYGDAMLEDEAGVILDRIRKDGLVNKDGDISYHEIMKVMRKPKDYDEEMDKLENERKLKELEEKAEIDELNFDEDHEKDDEDL